MSLTPFSISSHATHASFFSGSGKIPKVRVSELKEGDKFSYKYNSESISTVVSNKPEAGNSHNRIIEIKLETKTGQRTLPKDQQVYLRN